MPISANYRAASKFKACFNCGQKWPENNNLAFFTKCKPNSLTNGVLRVYLSLRCIFPLYYFFGHPLVLRVGWVKRKLNKLLRTRSGKLIWTTVSVRHTHGDKWTERHFVVWQYKRAVTFWRRRLVDATSPVVGCVWASCTIGRSPS